MISSAWVFSDLSDIEFGRFCDMHKVRYIILSKSGSHPTEDVEG
jgi:hypothetical protein